MSESRRGAAGWHADSAASPFSKALECFASAVEHLGKARADACVKAEDLPDDGNQQLEETHHQHANGEGFSAEEHYGRAPDMYDEAPGMID